MSRRPRPPSATVVVKRWGPTSSDGATPARFGRRQQPGLGTGQNAALSIPELRQCANAVAPHVPVPAQPKPDGASENIVDDCGPAAPNRVAEAAGRRLARLAGPAAGGARRGASCLQLDPRRLDRYGRLRRSLAVTADSRAVQPGRLPAWIGGRNGQRSRPW